MFADLVGIVAARACGLSEHPGDPGALDALREAVDALSSYLDAAEFVRRARGGPAGVPTPVAAPVPTPVAAPVQAGAPRERVPLPSSPRFAPFRDPDTGLLSREGFEHMAAGELKRCARHRRVFSLLLLRPAPLPDGRLLRLSDVLRAHLRASDLLGRDSAGTLAIALPETPAEEAREIARRLLARLGAERLWGAEDRLGVATHPTEGDTLAGLLEAARRGLALPQQQVLAGERGDGYWA